MYFTEWSEEYRTAADALSRRLAELRALLKTARGEEAFSLQRRIETMRAELTELRAVRAYPVSYTHLDVYKRQAMSCIVRRAAASRRLTVDG